MKKSFTLLELLIVVIVVAILVTFAIPQYMNVIERTKISKALNAIKLIMSAEKMYRAENDTYLAVAEGESIDAALGNYIDLSDVDNDSDWIYLTWNLSGINNCSVCAKRRAGLSIDKYICLYAASVPIYGMCYSSHDLGGCPY